MPRGPDTPVCGLNQTTCLMQVVRTWAQSEAFGKGKSVLCNCLPACFRIDYELLVINHINYDGENNGDGYERVFKV